MNKTKIMKADTTSKNIGAFFFRISSSRIFNSVCWSHALVNGPTSKRPASDSGRCSGQLLVMWSAVCAGSPHSHAALSASPHFFMEALYLGAIGTPLEDTNCLTLSDQPDRRHRRRHQISTGS